MALTAAPEDQALLLELQALDTRIRQLDHRAANLPERETVQTITARHAELERLRAQQVGAVEDARAELRRTESDVAVVDARITRDSERVAASASVKDVQALEQELAALAQRKSDLEDIELAVMETLETREATLAGTLGELEALAESLRMATAARDAAVAEIDADRVRAIADREGVAARLPGDLLALYERQRQRYGFGASLLKRGVTSASGVTLSATDMTMIRAAAPDEVILCPDSGAILVRTAESGL